MLLKIENLSFGYSAEQPILQNFNLQASAHESIGLVGANGVGKSTLLRLLVGLHPDFGGSIAVDGLQVEKKNLAQLREKIGYVFQDSDNQLFMSTAYEDIAFAPRNYGLSEDEVEQRVQHALQLTHSEYLRDKQIYKMSGGEKKLTAIATILSLQPQIILMDEPSNALDPRNRRNLIRILNGLDCLKIIATHDLDLVLDTCERTLLIADGRIVADGATQELLRNRKLLEANGLELPLSLSRG